MKTKIAERYNTFFKELNIDPTTGLLENDSQSLKFETYPYIGSKYEESDLKVLFVGLDVGKEENINQIQSFEDRRANIEGDFGFNPHIAGTYASALYLLKDKKGWNSTWDKISKFPTSSQATKQKQHLDNQNPLSYIALTNFFKFVDKGRQNRSGDKNRKFVNQKLETKLFINEVKLLNPKIIIFQGYKPSENILNELKTLKPKIFQASHPSNRKKDGRQPLNYVNNFIEL